MTENTGGKILLITDNRKEKLFSSLSFADETVEVCPLKKARDAVKDCRVDLILLDCSKNIDKGLKVLKDNKMSCPAVPNIFITGASAEGVVLKAFRAGARDFFRKPFSISELQHTVEALLSIKKSSREKRAPFIKPEERNKAISGPRDEPE